jgi:hypothetical protein
MVAFMTWNEFFTWSWWTGIAGIAQVLSLFGIALAVYQLVAARRRITVSLICHFWANAINDATGQVGGFVVDIVNAGGELAVLVSIQVVGGAVLFIPQEPINAAIPAGGKQTIFVTSDKPRDVWLRFHWVTPQDPSATRFVGVRSDPLHLQSAAIRAQAAAANATNREGAAMALRPYGPGRLTTGSPSQPASGAQARSRCDLYDRDRHGGRISSRQLAGTPCL